jgi:N-acetylmuramoyl-L-alanine amidase
VPACIIECGFISNPDELKLLLDDKYQYKLAMAILYGVNAYKI